VWSAALVDVHKGVPPHGYPRGDNDFMTFALLVQSTVMGVSIGSIYILMALGLTLMFGMMHIINFAHGAVYMLGAFVIYYFFFQWGTPYFFAFLLAMILLGVFGFLIERGIYRPIKGGIEPTLVALLAVTTFLQAAGYPVFGQLDKHVPTVFEGIWTILGVAISVERLIIIPIALVLVVGLYLFINKTKIGGAMRAIEQDKEAAALQGVNVNLINALAFGVGFALAAASGALIAPIFKLDPMMGEQPLLKAFIIIILGGLGSIPGAIIGGLMLGLIDSVLATAVGVEPAFLLSFVFIILLLFFKPNGLFGYV
jgi:branched-chain amino acid transport system permease protein